MMGDNRYCSKDSRYWGLVPRENIRGRPMFVYYSYRPGDEPALPLRVRDERSSAAVHHRRALGKNRDAHSLDAIADQPACSRSERSMATLRAPCRMQALE